MNAVAYQHPDGHELIVSRDNHLTMLNADCGDALSIPIGPGAMRELGERLDEAVAKAGCPTGARLAFRIEGRAKAASWSLDTLPTPARLTTLAAPVVIVGLYTTIDGARHAMPGGRRFHAHIVVPATDAAGHLQTIDLQDGAKLWLQQP